MKFNIGEIAEKIRDFRRGDRLVMNNDFSYKASVFRRSGEDNPFCSFGFDGGFQLTLIEVLLIAVSLVCVVFLLISGILRGFFGIFGFGRKKRRR